MFIWLELNCGPLLLLILLTLFFKKMGESRPLLVYFRYFLITIFSNTKCWWCAWVLNPGPQDGRRRRNHGAMLATIIQGCNLPPPTNFNYNTFWCQLLLQTSIGEKRTTLRTNRPDWFNEKICFIKRSCWQSLLKCFTPIFLSQRRPKKRPDWFNDK